MDSADQAVADSALTSAAIAGFTATYGRKPRVVWSAPGRANLIGEHTDYNEGLVLPFAIAERTVVAAGLGDGDGSASGDSASYNNADEVVVTSALYPETARARLAEVGPGVVPAWAGYPLGVAWVLSHSPERAIPVGASLYIQSSVPSRAGLSSSAALEIAVACALNDLWDLGRTAPELARAGRKAENEVVGAPTGIMDQYASLLGQADSAVFLDCRTEEAIVVPLRLRGAGGAGAGLPGAGRPEARPRQADLALVLIDTGERHSHAAGGYAARRASCERAARELGVRALRDVTPADLPAAARLLDEETFRRARHIVTEDERVAQTVAALEKDDMAAVGELLTRSHASMRDDFEITTPALDLAVDVALWEGALGTRMTGGGFGGAAIALIECDRVPALRQAAQDAFRAAGLGGPPVRAVIPSAGARQES
jgi:galactokinase